MDHRRAVSPPSISIPSRSHAYSRYRSSNRSPHHSPHVSGSYSRGVAPMSIPNASRGPSAPPPLPPPPLLDDIADGRDLAWQYANTSWKTEYDQRQASPYSQDWIKKENRSYEGGYFERSEDRRRSDSTTTITSLPGMEGFDQPPHRDEGYHSLSGSSFAQLQGERPLEWKNRENSSNAYDNLLLKKIGRPRTPSRASTAGSLESSPASVSHRATNKPSTSSRSSKQPQLKSLSVSDRSFSISTDSPLKVGSPYSSKWVNSPQSAVVSPGLMSDTPSAKSFMGSHRSSIFDTTSIASSSTSFGLGSEMATGGSVEQQFGRVPAKAQQRPDSNLSRAMMASLAASASIASSVASSSTASSTHSTGTGAGTGTAIATGMSIGGMMMVGGREISGRSNRGSYDHGNFLANDPEMGLGQFDSDLPMAETGNGMRHLNLDDRPPPLHQHHRPPHPASTFSSPRLRSSPHPRQGQGMQGVKRRASSPPREASHDDRPPPQQAQAQAQQGVEQRRTSGQHHLLAKRVSPAHHLSHPSHASYSSASSAGLPNGSYASSAGFSVGTSSIPTASPQDRLSPGIIPSTSEPQEARDSPFMSALSLDPGLRALDSQANSQIGSEAQLTAAAAQKMSAENANRLKQQSGTPKIQNIHICDCCPKKPKKFETMEDLAQHQAEKQYFCQYCHNRFKNKNEAERHQNSLHLRRHSWSCATLERRFGAAFYPCTAVPPHTNAGNVPPPQQGGYAAVDVCGYCGEEFPNNPEPDWVSRSEHLTKVHKFGECNQSKKFYRADHFRQHLKHSHGGTSGKWTNMLEAACMKDEPPVTQEAIALTSAHQAVQQAQAQAAQNAAAAVAAAAAQNQSSQQQPPHQQQQPPPALSSYQAAQLQGASAPVAMMGSGTQLRQGPYPAMPPMPTNGNVDLPFQRIEEEDTKEHI